MAKGNMEQYRREPFSCQTRHEATPEAPSDAEMFSVVQNSDYVLPNTTKRASASRAVETDDEAPAPLKSRIALGFLTVNGREEPVFAPIRGFEHLFAHKDVAAPWSPPSPPPPPQNTGKSREAQATETARRSSAVASSGTSRSRKRQRTHNQDHDDAQYADEEGESTTKIPTSFSIGDVDSLKHFYAVRFRELTMKPMRDVVTAWVKRLEPKRQKKYGPYQRYDPDRRPDQLKSVKPPWWPVDVPYIEPSHLKLQHLVPLAVDIMLIHRRIDEEVGKRKYPSWISMLETDALYLISSKDTEHFSSSRGAKYNEAMKKRALEIILPSVFDIAKSHEDYVAQHDLYEGSGNEDPGCGKQVSWQATPRPERGLEYKRPCPPRKAEFLYDDDGDETEVDEEAAGPSSTLSSFGSTFSYNVDIKKEEVESSSALSSFGSTISCTEEVREETAEPSSTLSSFGSTINCTKDVREEAVESSSTLSPFDSTFKYTEDVKMFPSPVPDEPPPTPEVAATQPLYQPPTPTSDAPMVSAVDHSMDRLHLYEDDSKPRLAFGQSPISVAPHRPTNLPYVFPHYHETAQGPYSYHMPNSFATCGPVVPHDVALGGALGPHGLPNNSHMHGLPDSNHMHGLSDSGHMHGFSDSGHMHGLSDSRQMHGFPNSRQMHGLPMHQVSAHDFSTHGMPLIANWSNIDALL